MEFIKRSFDIFNVVSICLYIIRNIIFKIMNRHGWINIEQVINTSNKEDNLSNL